MLTEKQVQQIASLARIHLKPDDISFLQRDLEKILDYIDKLSHLNVEDVEPTSHVLPLKNVYRDDIVKESLAQDAALSITKEKQKGAFKVPKVIE
jgi:aspartyl-tRNA(Asn)/glutamyl-tRNA(Gln) amidotransferase subunit C